MTNWKLHLFIGLAIEIPFIIVMWYFFSWYSILSLNSISISFLILISSPLVMDLDHKHGKLREVVAYIGLVIGLIGVSGYLITKYLFPLDLEILMIFGIVLASSAHLAFYVTKHRGFMHSIPFSLLYGGLIYLILHNYQLGVLSAIGCYSHLVGDREFFKLF